MDYTSIGTVAVIFIIIFIGIISNKKKMKK